MGVMGACVLTRHQPIRPHIAGGTEYKPHVPYVRIAFVK